MSNTTDKDILKDIPTGIANSPISPSHIDKISQAVIHWEDLAPSLGLTEAEEEAIKENNRRRYELQKRDALRKWKQKNGSEATYRQLIRILSRLKEIDLAEKVRDILVSTESAEDSSVDSLKRFHTHLRDCYTCLPRGSSDLQPAFASPSLYVPHTLRDVSASKLGKPCVGSLSGNLDALSFEEIFSNCQEKRKVVLIYKMSQEVERPLYCITLVRSGPQETSSHKSSF